MRYIALLGILLATPAAAVDSLSTGGVVAFAGANVGGTFVGAGGTPSFRIGDGISTASATVGTATAQALSQSSPFVLRARVIASSGTGATGLGAAVSSFTVNQRVEGAPGTTARVDYAFSLDGSLAPGTPGFTIPNYYDQATVYLYAARGSVVGAQVVETPDGPDLLASTTQGAVSQWLPNFSPYYTDSFSPTIIPGGLAGFCLGPAPFCSGLSGSVDTTLNIGWDQPVGEDYVLGALLVLTGYGVNDFSHTLRLKRVELDPGYTLVSGGDGALVQRPNGTYSLVPEPGTWALFILGFGIIGTAVRRRFTSARVLSR